MCKAYKISFFFWFCQFAATIEGVIRFGDAEFKLTNRVLHSSTHDILQSKIITLPYERPSLSTGEIIEFKLFGVDLAVGDVTNVVSRGPASTSWTGNLRLQSSDGSVDISSIDGYFGLSCYNLACSAHLYIESTRSEYTINPEGTPLTDAGEGLYVLSQIHLSSDKKSGTRGNSDFFGDSALAKKMTAAAETKIESMATANTDMDLIIDILVIYTPEAMNRIGASTSAMKSLIYLANDQSNTILSNSEVSLRLRVVDIESAGDNFKEPQKNLTSTFGTLLNWLTTANDGHLDLAQTYRELYKADLVLLVNNANSYCGLGWVNTGYSDTLGFANYNVGCMYGLVYMHEIGHILGCYHDRISDASTSVSNPTYLGFGHCWEDTSKTDCTCYSSVMVYDCNTVPNSCTSCSSKDYLANYKVMNSGSATGTTTSSCGLHIHNNRYRAIKYRKSIQPGGMIFSVTPSYAINTTCQIVNITGWQFSLTGIDIINVTLAGVPVTILSQTANSVVVRTSQIRNPSGIPGDVVVTSSTGRVTTSKSAFTFRSNIINDIETFTAKSLASTIWRSNGSLPWSFSTDYGHIALYKYAGSYTEYEAAELLSYTSPDCSDIFSYLAFQYWAYSTYTFCFGSFTVASRTSVTKGWTTQWTASGYTTETGATPWKNVSMSLPTGTVGIRIRIKTANNYACRWWSPVKIDNLIVKKVSTCASGCSNVITTSSACTPVTSSYLEQFSTKNLALTKWVSNSTLPWTFYTDTNNNAVLYKDASLGSTESKYSALIHNVVGSISSSGCNDTAAFLSFRYWSYSTYGYCSLFSVSTRTSSRDPWLVVWSGQGISTSTGSSTPWLNVSMDLPVGTKGIKFLASTQTYTNCKYYARFRLDDIALTYNTYCKGSVLCTSRLANVPTGSPIISPTASPSLPITSIPTVLPTPAPTTKVPTSRPTVLPTPAPTTKVPTSRPTILPTPAPTTKSPTSRPTALPTVVPTILPTTKSPTSRPTSTPITAPTKLPTTIPSSSPSTSPTVIPTGNPSTLQPTTPPMPPTTSTPTTDPTFSPTSLPSDHIDSTAPTQPPSSNRPTIRPSSTSPTRVPTKSSPTRIPTRSPTKFPTRSPTKIPTKSPTKIPTRSPTRIPTRLSPTKIPTRSPTKIPTRSPTKIPTRSPTRLPTTSPSKIPTRGPTTIIVNNNNNPSFFPTRRPS